jgi:hypothetical protein
MKLLSNPDLSKFVVSAVATTMVAGSAMAGHSIDTYDLSTLGSLAKNHSQGDARYDGASHLNNQAGSTYINQFARKMAMSDSEVPIYEDVLTRLVAVWNMEQDQKGFNKDLASGFATYTMVNVALANNKPYELNFFDNMVAQYRKAFSSKAVSRWSEAKKEDMLDYMVTESCFMQAMASAGRERDFAHNESLLTSLGITQVQNTFDYQPSKVVIAEVGVIFE